MFFEGNQQALWIRRWKDFSFLGVAMLFHGLVFLLFPNIPERKQKVKKPAKILVALVNRKKSKPPNRLLPQKLEPKKIPKKKKKTHRNSKRPKKRNVKRPLILKQKMVAKKKDKAKSPSVSTKVAKKKTPTNLSLQPKWSWFLPSSTSLQSKNRGKKESTTPSSSKKTQQPWEGSDPFSITMQKYHEEWKQEWIDRTGLRDSFFADATIAIDKCLEIWVAQNMKRFAQKEQGMLLLGITWLAWFEYRWSSRGIGSVKLLKSKGLRGMTSSAFQQAKYCIRRVQIPTYLKGKKLLLHVRTKATAKRNINVLRPLGFSDYRDPQTGQIFWKFDYLGEIVVEATSMFTKARILP